MDVHPFRVGYVIFLLRLRLWECMFDMRLSKKLKTLISSFVTT